MSVSNLLTPNEYDLQCKSITMTDDFTTTGNITSAKVNITTNGNLVFPGDAIVFQTCNFYDGLTNVAVGPSFTVAYLRRNGIVTVWFAPSQTLSLLISQTPRYNVRLSTGFANKVVLPRGTGPDIPFSFSANIASDTISPQTAVLQITTNSSGTADIVLSKNVSYTTTGAGPYTNTAIVGSNYFTVSFAMFPTIIQYPIYGISQSS